MQFSSSKLVVTDRLHGMIFSAITNTPCICFDNKNGKVSAQYEWIRNNSYVKLVDGLDGFCDVLRSFDIDRDYQYDRTNVMDKIAPLTECIKNVKKYGILR